MQKYLQSIVAITIIASLWFMSSCKKSENPTNSSDSDGVTFSGISRTDTLGNIIEDDTTDWQPRWENVGFPPKYPLEARPAFPNPAGRDSISWGFGERRLGCIITYCLNSASSVEVRVYDKPNSYIKTLVWGTHVAGAHQVVWDLTDSLNRPVPDGIYRVIIATQIQQIHGDIQVLR